MKNIYPLIYNNYNTRIIKQEENIYKYGNFLCGDIMRNINFIPGDGVDTSLIINSLSYTLECSPDYLVVADMDGNINSRWFVMKSERTTNGQYRFSLHRDVIVDYLQEIVSSDVFIQRGKVLDNDPAIWNNEDIPFNQIKQSETLLKDYTGMPWLVAYISPDVAQNSNSLNGSIEGYYDKEYSSLENYPYYKYIDNTYNYGTFKVRTQTYKVTPPSQPGRPAKSEYHDIILNIMANNEQDAASVEDFTGDISGNLAPLGEPYTYNEEYIRESWWKYSREDSVLNNATQIQNSEYVDNNTYNSMINENNKRIKVGTKIYKISINNSIITRNPLSDGAIYTSIKSMTYRNWLGTQSEIWEEYPQLSVCTIESTGIKMTIEEVQDDTSAFTYDFKGVNLGNPETPYGIITMPYEDYVHLTSRDGSTESLDITKENRIKILQALGKIEGLLYDIQLLPYCPLQNLTYTEDNNKTFSLSSSSADSIKVYSLNPTGDNTKDYFGNDPTKPVSDDNPANLADPNYANWVKGNYITSIYVAPRANVSFNIESPITLTNIKIQNSTDIWRLCSPNYASTFEFNAAKFYEGSLTTIQYFEVDLSFKPYTPYIHINPHFAGLYNRGDVNFNDARGLICSGDFSIDRISDSWETYKYNQKNWESSFNRQIDTMEMQKKYATIDAGVNSVLGTVGGIFGGLLMGGPFGALAGGIASAGAGTWNTIEQNILSQRNIDDTKAQFAYNNQNIRAQPYSIQKVSAINNNNKYFPVLEYYTCTEKEKELFKNYLKYYSMNVNRVDNIENYIYDGEQNYIQARLLRNTELQVPANIYNAINQELITGIYMEG